MIQLPTPGVWFQESLTKYCVYACFDWAFYVLSLIHLIVWNNLCTIICTFVVSMWYVQLSICSTGMSLIYLSCILSEPARWKLACRANSGTFKYMLINVAISRIQIYPEREAAEFKDKGLLWTWCLLLHDGDQRIAPCQLYSLPSWQCLIW